MPNGSLIPSIPVTPIMIDNQQSEPTWYVVMLYNIERETIWQY